VFAEAVRPRDAGAVEGLVQDLVKLLVQVEANVIIAVRAGEPGYVHREQGTHLPVSRRGGRPGRWAAHGWPVLGTAPLALAIRSSAQKLIRSFSLTDRGKTPAGKARPVASVQSVMRIAARRSSARPAAPVPGSPIPGSSGRGSRWVIAEESLAPNGRQTVVSYTLRLLPGGGEGGPSVVSWRSVPPVGHEIPGGPPAFGFLVVGLVPKYPRVISLSRVIQVFAAHVAIVRRRKKHCHGKCREFPPSIAGEPRSRAAPAGRPASDPPKAEYRLAGRPAGGLD